MKTLLTLPAIAISVAMMTLVTSGCGDTEDDNSSGIIHRIHGPESPISVQPQGTHESPPSLAPQVGELSKNGAAGLSTSVCDAENQGSHGEHDDWLRLPTTPEPLSITNSADHVFIGSVTDEDITIGVYDEQFSPHSLLTIGRTVANSMNQSCAAPLKIIWLQGSLGLIETDCGAIPKVTVRFISMTGEILSDTLELSLNDAQMVSTSEDFGRVVILAVGRDHLTWYEVDPTDGLRRTLTHSLTPQSADGLPVHIEHHGTSALLQYEDGQIKRAGYAYRCGTTHATSLMIEDSEGQSADTTRPFTWDPYGRQYVRHHRIGDTEHLEILPWNVSQERNVLRINVRPRAHNVSGEATLLLSVEGPRLVYQARNERAVIVAGAPGVATLAQPTNRSASVPKAWAVFEGQAAVLMLRTRCRTSLEPLFYETAAVDQRDG